MPSPPHVPRLPETARGAPGSDPPSPKRIYIANDDHTDYFWTADADAYKDAFLSSLDYYLDLADATAANPAPYQSRWNCDGSLWLLTYEQNRTPAQFERLIGRIRSGHVSVPLNTLVSCYGGQPAEAVLRGMYYSGRIERRHQLRFRLAVAMENQTLPLGLASLWAGAGAKYSWRGVCACATRVPDSGAREHEAYWYTGKDGARVLMKWNSLNNGDNTSLGGYAEARRPAEIVNYLDTDPGFASRWRDPVTGRPYRISAAFGKGWDDLQTLTDEFVRVAEAESNANRQVIVSNEEDFFQDFDASYGANLPVQSVTFGNEWDLYCASMAEVSARVKRAVEKLRAAEALATLVSLQEPTFLNGRDPARDLAFVGLGLYWEHDWTADGPVGRDARAAWQRQLAGEIETYVNTLHTDAADALSSLIPRPDQTTAPRFFAFNPLGWTRTDAADLPYAGDPADPVHVVDVSSGQTVPSQFVTLNGTHFLRVLAADVPPAGYKVFEVQLGAGDVFTPAAATSAGTDDTRTLENEGVRVVVNGRGAITSLVDKTRTSAELAASIGGRFINDLTGTGTGTVRVENAGPVSVTLLARSRAGLAHETRVTLFRASGRVEIANTITENFADVRTWAFGFNLGRAPDVRHEEVGAVLRAQLTTAGGDYSPRARNSRYDWQTLNHFADISDSANTAGVTLSNADCYFLRLGGSTTGALDTNTPGLSVLAGGQVDGPSLGILNQDGDTHFLQRFALRAHGAYDAAEAMRFALEHQNPLVAGAVTGSAAAPLPADAFALLRLDRSDVLLWALKPADEGIAQGVIVRAWNQNGQNALPFLVGLNGPKRVASARRVTHIETDLGAARVQAAALSATIGPNQMLTFRLLPAAPAAPPNAAAARETTRETV